MREEGSDKFKWHSHNLKYIAVGACNVSDCLLFYHPPSKQMFLCPDGFKFDAFSPAGPKFQEIYDGKFIFNTRASMDSIHRPPTHEHGTTAYIYNNNNYIPITVLSIPINDDTEHYIVQEKVT